MDTIDQIIEYLSNDKFDLAKSKLEEIWKKDSQDPFVNYLYGCYYDDYRNSKKSITKAQRHFKVAISGQQPVERAFLRLAHLEDNWEIIKRILLRGISSFPDSPELYDALLRISSGTEKQDVFAKMCEIGTCTENARLHMLRSYFELKKYNDALKIIELISTANESTLLGLGLFKGLCLFEKSEYLLALSEFERIINLDIKNTLEFAPHFLSILIYLRNLPLRDREIRQIFSQIPDNYKFIEPFFAGSDELYLDLMAYEIDSINSLIISTKEKDIIAKARGIRGLIVSGNEAYNRYSKKRTISDLKFAYSFGRNKVDIAEALLEYYEEKKEYLSSYKIILEILSHYFFEELNEKLEEANYSFIENSPLDLLKSIIEDFKKKKSKYELSEAVATKLLSLFIERLFKEKQFSDIVTLANYFGDAFVRKTAALFEVAYAFSHERDAKKSSFYYELLLKKESNNSAALNNLALIYEEDGDFENSEKMLRKAMKLDPESDLIAKNYKRIMDNRKASSNIEKMDFSLKLALIRLWEGRDIDNKISTKNINLSEFEIMTGLKIGTAIEALRKSKIIFLFNEESDQSGKRYTVSNDVINKISEIENEILIAAPILEISSELTFENLNRIGYNYSLISSLRKIESIELRQSLERDVKEAAYAFLTRSWKAAQVLCGSVIEAILLDKLLNKGIKKYKFESKGIKDVLEMSMDELINVCNQEGLINKQMYHFCSAVKGFRNLIHPGVEQRTKKTKMSVEDARIAWDVMRKIIIEA